jgi:integrase
MNINPTKGSIKKMLSSLYAFNRSDSDHVVHYLGPDHINNWIYEHLVSKTIKASRLAEYFRLRINSLSPNIYYRYYNIANTLLGDIKVLSNKVIEIDDLLTDETLIKKAITIMDFSGKRLLLFKKIISLYSPELDLDWNKLHQKSRLSPNLDHPVINRHLETYRHSTKESTIKKRILAYFHFLTWLNGTFKKFNNYDINSIPIEQIKKVHLNDYCAYLSRQVSLGTIAASYANYNQTFVFSFFQDLYKEGRIFDDLTINIEKIDYERYIYRDIPNDDAVKRFYEVINIYSADPFMYTLAFDFMFYMGLRKLEVPSICWEDINVFTEEIIVHSKGGNDHQLPIPTNIILKLKKIYELNKKGYVFSDTPKSFAQNLYDYYKIFSAIAKWHYPGGLHLLRHTFITKLSKNDECSIQLQQFLSRHDKSETNSNYVHNSDDELIQASNHHTIFRAEDTKLIPFIHGNS